MRKLIYLMFIFLFETVLFSQQKVSSGIVEYEIYSALTKEKLTNILGKIKSSKEDKQNYMSYYLKRVSGKKMYCSLLFNDLESSFKEKKQLQKDKKNSLSVFSVRGHYYTNKLTKKIVHQKEAYGTLFLVELSALKWKLTQETKKIGEYVCYKALTEFEVLTEKGISKNKCIAWYTPQIPVSFAPKGYFGLPGLVLELQEPEFIYKAIKISLSHKKNKKIPKPTKGKKMTKKEFEQMSKKMYEEFHN